VSRYRLILILDAEVDADQERFSADFEMIDRDGHGEPNFYIREKLLDGAGSAVRSEAVRLYREEMGLD
jgi:hypothetical protein